MTSNIVKRYRIHSQRIHVRQIRHIVRQSIEIVRIMERSVIQEIGDNK